MRVENEFMNSLFKPSLKKSEESFYALKSGKKDKSFSPDRLMFKEKDRRMSNGVYKRLSMGVRSRSTKKRSEMSSPDLLSMDKSYKQ